MLLALRNVYLMIFLLSFLCISTVSKGTHESNIAYLISSWNFNSSTEGFFCKFRGVRCWHPNENLVMNISLSQMGLQGKFPKGIQYCTSLVSLNLSSNKLSGPIPHNISHIIWFATSLDLSSNNFFGKIPAAIASCRLLFVLRLDNNRLTGNIPSEIRLLDQIEIFSVANNLLSGPVPDYINANFTNESYANNPGLCGGPLKPCVGHRNEFGSSFKSGFVIGYAVSAVSTIAVFVSCCVPWVHFNYRNKIISITTTAKLMMRKNRKNADAELRSPSMELVCEGGDSSFINPHQ